MKVDGKDIRTIWLDDNRKIVKIIDQRKLPHEFVIVDLKTVDDAVTAIRDMYVRGAPLIGATGAYGVYLATLNAADSRIDDVYMKKEAERIKSARPTAVNLAWGADRVLSAVLSTSNAAAKINLAREKKLKRCLMQVKKMRWPKCVKERGLILIYLELAQSLMTFTRSIQASHGIFLALK